MHIDTIQAYIGALQAGAAPESLRAFFCADALQIEYPNKLNPQGGESTVDVLVQRMSHAKQIIASERWVIESLLEQGERVAVEALWEGELRTGQSMRARFAMFFEMRGGLIYRQRNYDCFLP